MVVYSLYWGVIDNNGICEPLNIGNKKIAYIKNIREDLKLDISLSKVGYQNKISDIESTILSALEQNGGFLPLHDKSNPEEIKAQLAMSKKSFKIAVGGLYKAGKITIEENGIRLK